MGRCQDPLHQELCVNGDEKLPLRLIDVPATIASAGGVCFTLPSDWNFHVISHTWSLSIRELSEAVGKSIDGSCAGDPQLYSDAFRGRSFNDDGYTDFIRFLEVLMDDGVGKVWFDALCINQAENAQEEKEREILHMGAYYRRSAGCYVVLHGFGKGFDLLGRDQEMGFECLPRWFSRVWTLQEFLLPKELTFVVSRPSTTAPYCMFCTYTGNNIVASEEGEAALGMKTIEMGLMVESCMEGHCPIEIDTMKEFFKSKESFLYVLETLAAEHIQQGTEDMNAEPAHLSMVVRNVTEVMFCTNPHNTTLIRKAKNHQLYFVDREAYDLMTWLQYCPSRLDLTRHSLVGLNPWQACLGELFVLLGQCYTCASYKVLDMIQNRSCSRDEDRVLSILSLLGLEGRMQALRTNQTLGEQVVKLAQVLAKVNQSLLLELCAKDVTGSPHTGLSWMPNLGAPDHMESSFRGTAKWRMRDARVKLKEVTSEGALRLEGHVVGAHLVVRARGSMEQHFNEANCYTCLKSGALDSRGSRLLVHQMQDCHLEVPDTLSIPLHATAFVEATMEDATAHITEKGCSIRLDSRWIDDFCPDCDVVYAGGLHLPIPCLHFMPSVVDLILLLWAEVEGGESIVILCMGTKDKQLHKIGKVRVAQEVSKAIFFSNRAESEYNLGGFGRDDVAEFWRKWGAIQRAIPCNCKRTIFRKGRRSHIATVATLRKLINTARTKRTKLCYSGPEDIGPVEGLPSTSRPRPWPSTRIQSTTWLRRKLLQRRIDFFMDFPSLPAGAIAKPWKCL